MKSWRVSESSGEMAAAFLSSCRLQGHYRTNVRIHHSDILSLSNHHVHLKNGEAAPTDVLYGIGKSSTLSFFFQDLVAEFGLPHSLPHDSSSADEKEWAHLEQETDDKVFTLFPLLANLPPHYPWIPITSIFRLYNAIAPLNGHSIAFIGHVMVAPPPTHTHTEWTEEKPGRGIYGVLSA